MLRQILRSGSLNCARHALPNEAWGDGAIAMVGPIGISGDLGGQNVGLRRVGLVDCGKIVLVHKVVESKCLAYFGLFVLIQMFFVFRKYGFTGLPMTCVFTTQTNERGECHGSGSPKC